MTVESGGRPPLHKVAHSLYLSDTILTPPRISLITYIDSHRVYHMYEHSPRSLICIRQSMPVDIRQARHTYCRLFISPSWSLFHISRS